MAISKTLSIGAHLNPTETEQANLGTSSLKWNTIYAKTVSATSLSGTLSASNISGTIPVSKGGTGATSLTSGAALIGNGTGAITTKAIDTTATSESANLITSGAVYTGLSGKANSSHTHNYAGSSSAGGAATSAVKLETARTIRTNLASTSTASFNGSANITPGVTGTLPIGNGGTGATDEAGARAKLGLTLSESGNRFDVIPKIGADGVMEAGKYIDFHNADDDTSDYSARMTCGNNGSIDFSNGITSGGSPILTMQSYILKNVTIKAGSYNTQTMTINVPTGYYALGTLGYYLYNTSQGITMTRCFITAKTNKVYVNLYNSSSSSKTMSGESWVKVLFVKQEMLGTLQDPIAPASYS